MIILTNHSALAQQQLNNSIRIYSGDFAAPKFKAPTSPINQYGIAFDHRMDCKNWWGIKVFHMTPFTASGNCFHLFYTRREHAYRGDPGRHHTYIYNFFLKNATEIDLSLTHMIYLDNIHNRIGISISGEQFRMHFYRNALGEQTNEGGKIVGYIKPESEVIYGLAPGVIYDYNFYRQRFNIGCGLRYHIYSDYDFHRTDFMFYGGVNF